MKTDVWMKGLLATMGSALLGLMFATGANAANTEQVDVEVTWISAITIAETGALRFGLLDVAMLGTETVAIDTLSNVSDPQNNVAGGTQAAATFNTTAVAANLITILVDNIVDGADYTLGSFVCDYDGDTAAACDGAGMSETSIGGTIVVRVGATLTADGGATAGVDNGSFDLTIHYQ